MSWWDIGEGSGYRSYNGDLPVDLVTCGFCGEEGRFGFKSRLTKKNAAESKTLHYDVLVCEQCGNLTSVFWGMGSSGLVRFHQVPWPRKTTGWPKHWPDDVGRYWVQAKRSIEVSNYDAAALMARSAVQLVLRYQNASGKNLFQEIEDLGARGLLPPVMIEWAHEVRELGNDNAHPIPGASGTTSADAQAVVEYLRMLLKVIYDLPHQIEEHRGRKA
ncbi:DUF4145 domain-containing protein [Aminobacter sp. J44]|jgi:hypothetical protein|uniref:DUF4145 domain-containing protein n=1 Tax=Aminobacter sp. J44 TaxID=935262 RepID=UPI001199BD16|nr:DUF4145 domain-containing protein [Aminobacter sp. J44]TWG53823.1 uncharacterized protein DUF4145 [Aminobacter sp. J44]